MNLCVHRHYVVASQVCYIIIVIITMLTKYSIRCNHNRLIHLNISCLLCTIFLHKSWHLINVVYAYPQRMLSTFHRKKCLLSSALSHWQVNNDFGTYMYGTIIWCKKLETEVVETDDFPIQDFLRHFYAVIFNSKYL